MPGTVMYCVPSSGMPASLESVIEVWYTIMLVLTSKNCTVIVTDAA